MAANDEVVFTRREVGDLFAALETASIILTAISRRIASASIDGVDVPLSSIDSVIEPMQLFEIDEMAALVLDRLFPEDGEV